MAPKVLHFQPLEFIPKRRRQGGAGAASKLVSTKIRGPKSAGNVLDALQFKARRQQFSKNTPSHRRLNHLT
jgi:hypothetical protein